MTVNTHIFFFGLRRVQFKNDILLTLPKWDQLIEITSEINRELISYNKLTPHLYLLSINTRLQKDIGHH